MIKSAEVDADDGGKIIYGGDGVGGPSSQPPNLY